MREALENLLGGIHWRGLAAAWVLTLVAVGVLAATDAPVVISSVVLGGAAACVALAIAGETFTSARADARLRKSHVASQDAPTTPHSGTR